MSACLPGGSPGFDVKLLDPLMSALQSFAATGSSDSFWPIPLKNSV